MSEYTPVLKQEPPLPELTEAIRQGKAITWYRCKLRPADMKALHVKSDWRGGIQTLGYLGILILTASATWYSAYHFPWYVTIALLFLHGTASSFYINGVHELGHGTVFKTKWLNEFFCDLLAFLGWINPETFQSSHTRHHRYTLHPPDDLEVVLPVKLIVRNFLRDGFLNIPVLRDTLRNHWRLARGRFEGEWELTLYPESEPDKRRAPVRFSRIVLLGHAAIFLLSALTGQWMAFVVISLAPFIGNLLFFLCNNTQHIGLQDHVDDFRLCCRTFTLNPVVRFLYWQMNYHIEHHMYAAVPCYHLKRLHSLIRHDLPPTPRGLAATWREIIAILRRQEKDPTYQHVAPLPIANQTA